MYIEAKKKKNTNEKKAATRGVVLILNYNTIICIVNYQFFACSRFFFSFNIDYIITTDVVHNERGVCLDFISFLSLSLLCKKERKLKKKLVRGRNKKIARIHTYITIWTRVTKTKDTCGVWLVRQKKKKARRTIEIFFFLFYFISKKNTRALDGFLTTRILFHFCKCIRRSCKYPHNTNVFPRGEAQIDIDANTHTRSTNMGTIVFFFKILRDRQKKHFHTAVQIKKE